MGDEDWSVLADGTVETPAGPLPLAAAVEEFGDDGSQVLAYAERTIEPLLERALVVTRGTLPEQIPAGSERAGRVEDLRARIAERAAAVGAAVAQLDHDGVRMDLGVARRVASLLAMAAVEVHDLDLRHPAAPA